MAQEIKPTIFPERQGSFPALDRFFDAAKHILVRTKELAVEAKDLIVILFILFLLLRHCIEALFSK